MRQGSFVRKGIAPVADPGTRPGLHGQTLLSSGHPDLDRLLGGGLPLGSLLLLLEDGWSPHHATLLRYFLAEGAACGQSIMLAAAPAPNGGLPKFLPAQLKGKAAEKDEEEGGKEQEEFKLRIAWQYRRYIKAGQSGSAAGKLSSLGGSSSSSSSSSSVSARGSGLGALAGRSTNSSSSSSTNSSGSGSTGSAGRKPVGLRDWCHRFDLLKPAGEEGLQGCRAELVDCSSAGRGGSSDCCSGSQDSSMLQTPSSTQHLLSAAAAFVQLLAPPQPPSGTAAATAAGTPAAARAPLLAAAASLPPRGPQHVGRIAVLSLGSFHWQLGGDSGNTESRSGGDAIFTSSSQQQRSRAGASNCAEVARALLQLKGLVRDRRCTAVVSVPAALFSQSEVARMQHIADCVIALESVADDSDIARLAPDPSSVAGLLHLRKLPCLGTASPPVPEVALHLIRHKRRRLAITPVEIDPDAELADAEAASGAGRSVAAVLCGGPAKADKAIDF